MAIYFIRAGDDGPVKIGTTRDPAARKAALQTSHYESLSIIRVLGGGAEVERRLHWHFRSLKIRGEWFRYSPDMLTVVATVLPPPPVANIAPQPGVYDDRQLLGLSGILAEHGIERRRFAQLVGVHPCTLTTWCRHRSGRRVIERVLRALGSLGIPCSIEQLVSGPPIKSIYFRLTDYLHEPSFWRAKRPPPDLCPKWPADIARPTQTEPERAA